MGKEYQFPAEPQKCKGCGLELAGKSAELGAMRGSQPMGYCPMCGYPYQIVEIESGPVEPAPEAEAKAEPEPEPSTEPAEPTEPEPVPEPETPPAAEPEPEPEPEPAPEPEPEA